MGFKVGRVASFQSGLEPNVQDYRVSLVKI